MGRQAYRKNQVRLVQRLSVSETEPREREIQKSRNPGQTNQEKSKTTSSKTLTPKTRTEEKSPPYAGSSWIRTWGWATKKTPTKPTLWAPSRCRENTSQSTRRRHYPLWLLGQRLCALDKRSESTASRDRKHRVLLKEQARRYLFEGIDSKKVSRFLSEKMPGLTAKVFRTWRCTKTVKEELEKSKVKKEDPDYEKMYAAKMANLKVAEVANHKRKIPPTFDERLAKKETHLKELEASWHRRKRKAKKPNHSQHESKKRSLTSNWPSSRGNTTWALRWNLTLTLLHTWSGPRKSISTWKSSIPRRCGRSSAGHWRAKQKPSASRHETHRNQRRHHNRSFREAKLARSSKSPSKTTKLLFDAPKNQSRAKSTRNSWRLSQNFSTPTLNSSQAPHPDRRSCLLKGKRKTK